VGCSGGLMDNAFSYVISNGGIDSESSYPFEESGPNRCNYNAASCAGTITGYQDVQQGSESALQTAVANGPVSVGINAGLQSFQMYSSGVYDDPACAGSESDLDHGVLAVGYGVDGYNEFWLVKNQWGTDWGMDGYIEMSRDKNNQCGIATAASYPTGAATTCGGAATTTYQGF